MKYFLFLCCFVTTFSHAQDPNRFGNELTTIAKKYASSWDSSKETILFTGSSSIRMWKNLQEVFPEYQIVNTGFGGSHASDLLHHLDALVLKYNPKKVFIYEGDNDIFAEKKPKEILATLQEIIHRIQLKSPQTKIVLISAKPSIARWHLKKKYKNLNRKMKRYAKRNELIGYTDVWKPMLNKRKLIKHIFIKDGLHMNSDGYYIWYSVIKNQVN